MLNRQNQPGDTGATPTHDGATLISPGCRFHVRQERMCIATKPPCIYKATVVKCINSSKLDDFNELSIARKINPQNLAYFNEIPALFALLSLRRKRYGVYYFKQTGLQRPRIV